MLDLPLCPEPRPGWQADFDAAMADEYVRRKYRRERSIREHIDLFARVLPEIGRPNGGVFASLGCGFGVDLEIARHHGWRVLGIEPPNGAGGMGDAYVRAARLLHERQRLPVDYCGWRHCVATWLRAKHVGIWWSRGSWEQCHAEFLDGEPHDANHDCRLQDWRRSPETAAALGESLRFMADTLLPGGAIVVYGNGTGSSAGQAWYNDIMLGAGEAAGLTLVLAEDRRLHKWVL